MVFGIVKALNVKGQAGSKIWDLAKDGVGNGLKVIDKSEIRRIFLINRWTGKSTINRSLRLTKTHILEPHKTRPYSKSGELRLGRQNMRHGIA